MKLSVGDVIVGVQSHNMGRKREITEVRETGYTWKYPDIEGQDWWSENSNDPFFFWGWKKFEN